jgi:2-polyprenyl-6-hydroxyphenyl methylase/3-demethylubiquinone-9 3-methyltransferase
MTADASLKDIASHFAFGENWASYAETIDELRLNEAQKALATLIGEGTLADKSFLDLGSGSGVHAVAAVRLGAAHVVAVDIDPKAVATTAVVLREHAPKLQATVRELSAFDLRPDTFGLFDVVYSWGVLHHTGAMREALAAAARVVAPGGLFAFALYRRTALCGFWRHEKRWYASTTPRAQRTARALYVTLLRLGFLATGRNFQRYVENYQGSRGMNFMHNVHDWLGGHPYESISPSEVNDLMRGLGFAHVRSFTRPARLGIFGSGCDEYVYQRAA